MSFFGRGGLIIDSAENIVMKYFLPIAVSLFGNLWLWTVNVSGNQLLYRGILLFVILVGLIIAFKNIWQFVTPAKRSKLIVGILFFSDF